MLGIHRDQSPAMGADPLDQTGPAADQTFLVRKGHYGTGVDGRQGWRQACKSDDGGHDPVCGKSRRCGDGSRAGLDRNTRAPQTGGKVSGQGRICDDRDLRTPGQGLICEPGDIAPARQRADAYRPSEGVQEVQGGDADRSRRSEDGDRADQAQCPNPGG